MSKVLIDRALLSVASLHLEYSGYTETGKKLRALLDAPSGTPAMPVKAYYHEAPNEYGGFNKSVGLEVRKEFTDAPLVLESDAMECIACLEGEIAKRDEELAACRVAVENCDLFRARIAELEEKLAVDDDVNFNLRGLLQRGAFALGLDPENTSWFEVIGELEKQSAELAAIKAQDPVEYQQWSRYENWDRVDKAVFELGLLSSTPERFRALYAAPVSEAKAQGVVMPDGWRIRECEDVDADLKGFIISSPLMDGERSSNSVWHTDADPAHRLLYEILTDALSSGKDGE